jgi:hypothetical protein
VSSSEQDGTGVPRSSDAGVRWAADTDPVGPVTPELALVDPGLAHDVGQREVSMSTAEFGDGATLGPPAVPSLPADGLLSQAPTPVPAAAEPPPAPTLQPLPPLQPVVPAEPVAAAPAPAPAVPVADMRDVPLGTLIFRAGLLSEEQLQAALEDGTKRGKRLGEVLLERGLVSENDLGRLLAGQKGLQFAEVDPAAVDPSAVALLPVEKARLYSVLPIGFQEGIPVVAIADPSNDLVVENVRRALACEPLFVVAAREPLHRAIDVAYGAAAPVAVAEPPADPVPAPPMAAQPLAPVQPVAPAEPAFAVVEPVAPVEPAVPVAPAAPVAEPLAQPEPLVPLPAVEPLAQPVEQPVETPVVPAAAAPPSGDGVWLAPPAAEPVAQPPLLVAPPAEPVAEPTLLAPPPVEPEPAQQPVVAPLVTEPLPAEPVVAFEPAPEIVEPVSVEVPAPPVELPEHPAAEHEPAASEEPEDGPTWTVAVRLSDGDRVEVGTFRSSDEAKEQARTVALQLETGTNWPFFASRFLRPEAIVSVDLIESEQGRWLGSAVRRALNNGN